MASLLFEPTELLEFRKLARLLDFFGVSATRSEPSQFLAMAGATKAPKSRLLCSARAFLNLMTTADQMVDGARFWRENVHSAFVYAAGDAKSLQKLARSVSGDDQASVVQVPGDATWLVANTRRDFCKSMSGIRVHACANVSEWALAITSSNPGPAKLVSCEAGTALLELEYHGVPVFLSTTGAIIDLDAGLRLRAFDIRQDFLSAVPVVMYVRWAFDTTCWKTPVTCACLVIDDPLLRPRYGFLDFRQLLDHMRVHDFSTNIAFIPWNWRRSSEKVVRLFKENSNRLSLSIHGCDHTEGEFGGQDERRITWRVKHAALRMERHEAITGIPFDPVMVFPQGVFSENAMSVLKRSAFIGSVNSEVISNGEKQRTIKVADYWDIAVMNYCDFPIFTRRYPSEGIENFAFDILLGKPCLVVAHHNDCHNQCRTLISFIDKLNELNAPLSWCGLGQVVRRSARRREIFPDIEELEMYGSELQLHNTSRIVKQFRIRRRERKPSVINGIRAGTRLVDWHTAQGLIIFDLSLNPGESETIRITYAGIPDDGLRGESLGYRARAGVRRYLSEMRDNYVFRNPFRSVDSK
jgi:hypothetical protein